MNVLCETRFVTITLSSVCYTCWGETQSLMGLYYETKLMNWFKSDYCYFSLSKKHITQKNPQNNIDLVSDRIILVFFVLKKIIKCTKRMSQFIY